MSTGDIRSGGRDLSTELLLRRLRAVAPLSALEVDLVLSLGEQPKLHEPGTSICPQDDGSPHSRLMVSGWACRPRLLPDGRCQMLGLLLPGDLMGDRGERRPLSINPVMALTPVRTISVARLFQSVASYPERFPGLSYAVGAMERREEMTLLDHVVRLGCQNARERFCHLMLELYARLSAIDFVHNQSFQMPLTQDTLGELLGLSLVHINRIVAQLRRDNLVSIRRGVVTIDDLARLSLLADRADPSCTCEAA